MTHGDDMQIFVESQREILIETFIDLHYDEWSDHVERAYYAQRTVCAEASHDQELEQRTQ